MKTILALFACLAFTIPQAQAKEKPKKERLTYNVKIMNANAAEATIITKNSRHRGKNVKKVYGTLKSKPRWKKIRSVENSAVSVIGKDRYPRRTEISLNNHTSGKKYVHTINYSGRTIHGTKTYVHKKKFKTYVVPTKAHTHDVISWVPYLRHVNYRVGERFQFEMFSGNRLYSAHCKTIGTADLLTDIGIVTAYKVSVQIFRGGRLYQKATLWVSADSRRIPLMFSMNTKYGRTSVEITQIAH